MHIPCMANGMHFKKIRAEMTVSDSFDLICRVRVASTTSLVVTAGVDVVRVRRPCIVTSTCYEYRFMTFPVARNVFKSG